MAISGWLMVTSDIQNENLVYTLGYKCCQVVYGVFTKFILVQCLQPSPDLITLFFVVFIGGVGPQERFEKFQGQCRHDVLCLTSQREDRRWLSGRHGRFQWQFVLLDVLHAFDVVCALTDKFGQIRNGLGVGNNDLNDGDHLISF